MAKVMTYTDERGVNYTTSYWRLVAFDVDVEAQTGEFTFAGYRDKEARDEAKAVIGRKTYNVGPDKFAYYYAKHLVDGLNMAQCAYLVADDFKEDYGNYTETTGEGGFVIRIPVLEGFFKNATDDV